MEAIPRELNHLSTSRRRNQFRDSLSSGERKGKSPNSRYVIVMQRCTVGVEGLICWGCMLSGGVKKLGHSGTALERPTGGGESPVHEMSESPLDGNLSTVGHVESCWNLGGPPSKAK
jgi:hypothetical protein